MTYRDLEDDYEFEQDQKIKEKVRESFVIDYEKRREMQKETAITLLQDMITELQKDDNNIAIFSCVSYQKGLSPDKNYLSHSINISFKKIEKSQQEFTTAREV